MNEKKVFQKLCNVYPKGAIITNSRRIAVPTQNVLLGAGEIVQCLQYRARVDEVLNDGTTITLNMYNYNKDNNAKIKAAAKVVEQTPVVTAPTDVVKEVLEVAPAVDAPEVVLNPLGLTPEVKEEVPAVEEIVVKQPIVEDIAIEEVIPEEVNDQDFINELMEAGLMDENGNMV